MKKFFIALFAIALIVGYFGYGYYQNIFSPNTPSDLKKEFVYIPTNSSFDEVLTMLVDSGFIENKSSFVWVANYMDYPKDPMRAGRYKVKPNMSNKALVGLLRNGEQAPVRIAIHNKWTVNHIGGLLAEHLELDSLDFAKTFNDEAYLSQFGLDKQTAMTAFIPDSYDFYWNTSAEDVFKKMVFYRDKFWNEERTAKAKALGLTKEEVYTLASIVDAETDKSDEMSKIAGLYLNRLKRSIPLESDPTAKFGIGDFAINRVLFKHLEVDSPFNTYKRQGLPPGPIYMSAKSALKGTLNPAVHNYIFMCAQPGGTGYHNFATSNAGHERNVAKYRAYSRKLRMQKRLKGK
jgi:UPF0755 protein